MARSIDRQTIDRLVVEQLPAALRFATRLTGNVDTAEEVVQEALCRVLRKWQSYREDATFRTWLFQIVVNVDRDRRRGQRRQGPMPTDPLIASTISPLEQSAANEMLAEVRVTIDGLPQRQREVAILSLGEGLAAREVAGVLGITEANVHTCLHLARKRIARAIGIDYAGKES